MTLLFTVTVLLLAVSSANAHNWLKSRSRSVRASALRPALPRRNFAHPHIMVGPDTDGEDSQPFMVEWATGHNSAPAYFTLLRASDENLLRSLKREQLEEYLNEAPSQFQTPPPRKFRKYARKPTGGSEPILSNGGTTNFFEAHIQEGMPNYMPRPATWDIGTHWDTPEQMEFKDSDVVDDRRAQYQNEKYPFIISVQRYTMPTRFAQRGDFAQVVIPKGFPTGPYIVWYLWGGYSDMTDVDFVSQPVQNIYGSYLDQTTTLVRIDHCGFEKVRQTKTCIEVMDDLEYSRDWARKINRAAINGYLVAPLITPPQVSPHLRDVEVIPWGENCKKEDFPYKTNRTLVVVGVESRLPGETFDSYTTTDDPKDPFFYSTCLIPTRRVQFENLPPPPIVDDVGWRHQDNCLPCELQAANSYLNVTPIWNLADHCVNCDVEPFTGNPAAHWLNLKLPETMDAEQVATHQQLNGFDADRQENPSIVKKLFPGGVSTIVNGGSVNLQKCYFLAARDPECTDEFVSANGICYCYRIGQTSMPRTANNDFRNVHLYKVNDKEAARQMFLEKY